LIFFWEEKSIEFAFPKIGKRIGERIGKRARAEFFCKKTPKKKIEFSIELAGAQEDANWRGGVFLFRLRGMCAYM
jgi:hypothetical protein